MTLAQIHIKRFFTQFSPAPTPENPEAMRAVDWVEYGPVGSLDKCTTVDKISRLRAVVKDTGSNPVAAMANAKWSAIEPFYEAWKKGNELPETGTPLAAWNGVSPEQAEALKLKSVRTVEDVAALTDAHVQRFAVPGLRDLILAAQLYLKGSDARLAAAKMGELESENAALRAEMEEIRQMLTNQLMVDGEDGESAPPVIRRPGRPRKVEAA